MKKIFKLKLNLKSKLKSILKPNSQLKSKLKAFSLIEVMISLIVVSALSAAFVPVMTKKMKKTINVSPKITLTQNCAAKFTSDCAFCDMSKVKSRCIICNKLCSIGQFKVTETCTCKSCTTIDSNCTVCSTGAICNTCKPGYYLQNNACKPCEASYYCPDGVNRKKCEAGYYCPARSSNHQRCAGGKWSNTGRTTACTDKCEAGYACKNGAKTYCVAGSYSNAGAATCSPCGAGYYCTGGTNRTLCNAGTYSNAVSATSSATCVACGAGYYCTGGSSRATCSSKTTGCATCNASNGTCRGCSAAYYLKGTSCSPCEAGYYCTGGSSRATCSSKTTGCATCNASNGICSGCSAGYYLNGTICSPCEAGYYCTGGTNHTLCPAGTYSNAVSATSSATCVACGAGHYCSGGSARAACGAGSYSSAVNAVSSAACATCEAGYYCTGGSARGACNVGTYSLAGASRCSNCALEAHCTACSSTTGACSACENTYYLLSGKCVRNCSLYAGTVRIGDYCVHDKNVGDGVPIPGGVPNLTVVNAGTMCRGWDCCWRATASNPTGIGEGGPAYDVRYRTLCSFNAGLNICAKLGGRIPTIAEASIFANSLQLLNMPHMQGTNKCYGTADQRHYYANNMYAGTYAANWCWPNNHLLLDDATANINAVNSNPNHKVSNYRYSFGNFYGAFYAGQGALHQKTAASLRCIF